MLSYGFWQRRFAGDAGVIGRRLTLSGTRYEIIGVVGPEVEKGGIAERSTLSGDIEIDSPPDVYVALQVDRNSAGHSHSFNVAGRLRPGVTLGAANAQLQASYREFARRWPGIDSAGRGFAVQRLHAAIVGGVRSGLLMLWGAVGLVLLIACANVASLLLARATGRSREMAIRAAVGAARGRLVRQLLTESVVLSMAGGVAGIAAGYGGIRGILNWLPGNIPRIGAGGGNVAIDWRVAGFTLGLSMAAGIVFGLVPALSASRGNLSSALKKSGNGGATGWGQKRARQVLAASEMALAAVLLIGAALLIRSFIAMRQVNPGFDAHGVLTLRMSLAGPEFDDRARVSKVLRETTHKIRTVPGVEMAATTCCVPLEDRLHGAFRIVGRDAGGLTGWALVSAGYFETLRIPVLRGRTFEERDENGSAVAIINETAANKYWSDRDPLKEQIVMGKGAPRQIIGVVEDVREEALNRDPRPNVYLPSTDGGGISQEQPWAWVVRTRVDPRSLSNAIRKGAREASGGLPVADVRTMEEVLRQSTAEKGFSTLVLTIFGCSAVVLASIGIYGLMAYSVAQRRREIGIRMALGAELREIRRMVVWQGLRPALAGVAGGVAGSFGLSRWLAGLLFGVKAQDPAVFVCVPVALAAVSLAAVWIPAIRASRADVLDALQHE